MTTPRVTVPVEPEGGSPFYSAAYDSIRKGAPGLSDATCAVIARSINMKVALLSAAPAPEGGAVERACQTCNSPRAVDPCPKCGTALTKPADGWEWPRTPDVDRIRALAREVGYAIGVHGTQERDLDLIAAPWVVEAVTPLELALHIATGLGGSVLDYKTQDKPCGRWSCNIDVDGWFKLIDLSVMPPITHPAPDALRVAVEAIRAEINAPLTGPTHGAWDRGRIAGLKEALAALQGAK